MSNINITVNTIEFTSTFTLSLNLIEPRWEAVDESSFHIITDYGVFLISVAEHKLNSQKFNTSDDALEYLNSL